MKGKSALAVLWKHTDVLILSKGLRNISKLGATPTPLGCQMVGQMIQVIILHLSYSVCVCVCMRLHVCVCMCLSLSLLSLFCVKDLV